MEELPRVFRVAFHKAARKLFQPPDRNFHCPNGFVLAYSMITSVPTMIRNLPLRNPTDFSLN